MCLSLATAHTLRSNVAFTNEPSYMKPSCMEQIMYRVIVFIQSFVKNKAIQMRLKVRLDSNVIRVLMIVQKWYFDSL